MRKFISKSIYQYNEMQVAEYNTDKTFTLTQRATLFKRATLFTSDYYTVYRFRAVQNVNADTIAEPDSYVYQFNYMCNGCTLISIIVDEQTALQFISDNLLSFIQGKINSNIFENYFEKHLTT